MNRTIGCVLKKSEVEVQGKLQLDNRSSGPAPLQRNGADHTPKCHIIENNTHYALIEVTCACGSKMYLQCDYLNTQAQTADSKKQNQNQTVTADNNQENKLEREAIESQA